MGVCRVWRIIQVIIIYLQPTVYMALYGGNIVKLRQQLIELIVSLFCNSQMKKDLLLFWKGIISGAGEAAKVSVNSLCFNRKPRINHNSFRDHAKSRSFQAGKPDPAVSKAVFGIFGVFRKLFRV